jgi:hypothetical protein
MVYSNRYCPTRYGYPYAFAKAGAGAVTVAHSTYRYTFDPNLSVVTCTARPKLPNRDLPTLPTAKLPTAQKISVPHKSSDRWVSIRPSAQKQTAKKTPKESKKTLKKESQKESCNIILRTKPPTAIKTPVRSKRALH